MSQGYGEIQMSDGHSFRWQMTGTTTPEVYGWIEKDGLILKNSGGWWRTDNPQEAVKRASASFEIELLE